MTFYTNIAKKHRLAPPPRDDEHRPFNRSSFASRNNSTVRESQDER